jgi:hypothetical protein
MGRINMDRIIRLGPVGAAGHVGIMVYGMVRATAMQVCCICCRRSLTRAVGMGWAVRRAQGDPAAADLGDGFCCLFEGLSSSLSPLSPVPVGLYHVWHA